MIRILAASAGILAVSRLPSLPSFSPFLWLSFSVLIFFVAIHPRLRWLACFGLGASWAFFCGQQILQQQLPPELEGKDLLIQGVIRNLPEDRGEFQRFEFAVSDYLNLKPGYARDKALPERLLLSWYGGQSLRVGQRWTLRVKLSRPRGFVNRGGFDYQRWLLSRGFGAKGYVRASTHNELHGLARGFALQKQRERVRDWLADAFEPKTGALLLALAIGDSSFISNGQWELLRRTGTVHLMAISGLHVGLVAILGYWLGHGLRALLALQRTRLGLVYWLPGIVSCLLAALYSAMAGFALPTQRALVMVLLANLAILMARVGSSSRALAWALLIVLVIDPLSGYEMGFWLSFGAVGVLLFYFRNRQQAPGPAPPAGLRSVFGFGRAQWAVSLGLVLPLLALNQPVSLLSPLANLVAIPLVSFLVVPPLLAGVLLKGPAGALLVSSAGHSLSLGMDVLEWLSVSLGPVNWSPQGGVLRVPALLAGALGLLLILAPRGLPGRWLGLPFLLPLLLPSASQQAPLRLTVLDVGQGLALVIRTPKHSLVYDTGPAYSERFNAGEAVVGPYLRSLGIQRLDRLIVSHGDGDHAGGAGPLLEQVRADRIQVGEHLPHLRGDNPDLAPAQQPCDRNERWRWDSVGFALIEPPGPVEEGNDRSCILLVDYAGQRILVTGDIGARVESALLAAAKLPAGVSVLIAPHHGSLSSSSQAFVERLQPRHVVYSAGYRSRYGHPHPRVQQRYEAVGSEAHNTAHSGQLDFVWSRNGDLRVEALRETGRRYWYDDF